MATTLEFEAMVPARYAGFEAKREQYGHALDSYVQSSLRADPLADAVIEALEPFEPRRREQLLSAALSGRTDEVVPPALVELLHHASRVPPWVDFEQMEKGGAVVLRGGLFSAAALLCYSLPLGYLSPGGTKPLVMTGALVDNVVPRLRETARFLVETCRPGGLRVGATGFQHTLRVRLMHARVRRRLAKSGRWDAAEWGAPINQADMLGTNLMFSLAMIDALRTMGFRPAEREVAAMMMLWRYSGQLVGVEPELLPETEHGARRTMEMILAIEKTPDSDGRTLTKAMLEALRRGDSPFMGRVLEGVTRGLLGTEYANALGVPKTPFALWVPMMRPVIGVLERARQWLPMGEVVARGAGTRAWEAVINSKPDQIPQEFSFVRQAAHVARTLVPSRLESTFRKLKIVA